MKLLKQRHKTHGNWHDQGFLAQVLKKSIRCEDTYNQLTYQQQEALDNILTKVSRIVCGDATHGDHWADIVGYAELGNAKANKPSGTKSL